MSRARLNAQCQRRKCTYHPMPTRVHAVRMRVAVCVFTSPVSAFFTTNSAVLSSGPWSSAVMCFRSRPLHSFPFKETRMSPDATALLLSAHPPSLILLTFHSFVEDCLNVNPNEHFVCLKDDTLATETASSSLPAAAPASTAWGVRGASGWGWSTVSLRCSLTMKVSSDGLRCTTISHTDSFSPVNFSANAMGPSSVTDCPSTVWMISLERRSPLSNAAPPSLSFETSYSPLDCFLKVNPRPASLPFSLWTRRFPTRLVRISCSFFMNSSSACFRCSCSRSLPSSASWSCFLY
mmetsp:Transcript_8441/g.16801  ORF Transcript_8441/g.16801 Transcript_8441/m.16801 type:complete len:293 (-) Transcript_8441:2136-3014(-)